MLKFIIQREYLLPVYQYEADTFEEAHAEAAGPGHDWYNAEEVTTAPCPRPSPTPRWSRREPRQTTTSLRVARANRAEHTRAKAAVLDLQRPGLRETRTLRWREMDSNFQFRAR